MRLTTLQKLYCCVSHRICGSHFSTRKFHYHYSKYSTEVVELRFTMPLIYQSLDSTLDVFNKKENIDVNGVKPLLEIYHNAYDQYKKHEAVGEVKKYPLIVLEGLDGCGKTTTSKRLVNKLNAENCRTPPESVSKLRTLFDNSPLRTAFYCLGNYIAALEVQLLLAKGPVVMDRYWHSTAAYALAQAVQDNPHEYKLPPKGDSIYCWPEDLFKPDIVLLLHVSEAVRLQRQSRRTTVTVQEGLLQSSSKFRQNVLQAYQNMSNPGVEIVNGSLTFKHVLREIDDKTRHLF